MGKLNSYNACIFARLSRDDGDKLESNSIINQKALIRDFLSKHSDYTMAEFTIFPSFRRRHLALDAAKMILARHPGKWEIKYNEKNKGAKNLWQDLMSRKYTI